MQHPCFLDRAAVSAAVVSGLLRLVAASSMMAVAMGAAIMPASAQGANAPAPAVPSPSSMGPKCSVVPDLARIERPLTRFAFRLAGGLPIKVVAIGSSSTAGAGASAPAGSYPSRLEAELGRHFPGHQLTVVNRGVNGEEAPDMVARFEKSVIAEAPHLVLWQVGTNSL